MSFSLLLKIINSPGYSIKQKLLGIDMLKYFLQMNLNEFDISVKTAIEENDLWYEQNDKYLELHMVEIARRSHNYLSSYYSLYELTQKFRNSIKDEIFSSEYEKKVKEIFDTQESEFVKNLREYFQHYDIPPIRIEITNVSFGYAKTEKRILLDTGKLLKYERFSTKMKQYIKKNKLDLVKLLHTHNSRILIFYKWFNSAITEKYNKELVNLQEYEKEYINDMKN